MGLLRNIFGGSWHAKDMHRLLDGPAKDLANGMEDIYRNQIFSIQEKTNVDVSASGILKARLFGVTFMTFVFGTKWQRAAAFNEMIDASWGVAMEPLGNPLYCPQFIRNETVPFPRDYMTAVFHAIAYDNRRGPSTPMNRTSGFATLVTLYEDALEDSLGGTSLTPIAREQLLPTVVGAIHGNLERMTEWMQRMGTDHGFFLLPDFCPETAVSGANSPQPNAPTKRKKSQSSGSTKPHRAPTRVWANRRHRPVVPATFGAESTGLVCALGGVESSQHGQIVGSD